MNSALDTLHPYPFEKLAALLAGIAPPTGLAPLNISIGEPQHPVAPALRQTLAQALDGISRYPTTRGQTDLRQAMAGWLCRRFGLGQVDPETQVLPVNGTREALFSIAQAVLNPSPGEPPPLVAMPNPFYQIYEGATLMAGGKPLYVNATPANGLLPDYERLAPELLDRVELLYLCSPSNPTGAVFSLERLQALIRLADRHDFVIASDECYSEIWYDQPPPGLLEAAWRMGRTGFERCLVFHSLSKRSNMPGARTGFVAGDAALLAGYFKLRTYTGCATPPFIQAAAVAAWQDESHVEDNRRQYREKLADAEAILAPVLPVNRPQAGFYLWLEVPGDGEAFTRALYADHGVTVLPGAYLGRDHGAGNPGNPYVRVALVAPPDVNREAMKRLARCARDMK
ncbi:MAG: succinyldiaminopimelate transaminase [Magnetococcales bacterium]|nr:succinyldiaminopimelate transaminase [Magnetococcales bacterium]